MADPKHPDVLVTGSSGHLGTALMLTLQTHGYTPLGIDILPSPHPNTHSISVTDRTSLARILKTHPSIKHVIHAATLHKPHVDSHEKESFIHTNVLGTLALLEECTRPAVLARIESFVFLSTTSAFGAMLAPPRGTPAAWVASEDIGGSGATTPKNIYGTSKLAAEDLCFLFQRTTGLPVLVLRTSRFFPEDDDDATRRAGVPDQDNLKVLELAYRRLDIEDAVSACVCAMRSAQRLRWGRYVVSAPAAFARDDGVLAALNSGDEAAVAAELERVVPGCGAVFAARGWKFLDAIDRVYDSSAVLRDLGWQPKWTFRDAVARLAEGKGWRSELTEQVGRRGYHAQATGVYTA